MIRNGLIYTNDINEIYTFNLESHKNGKSIFQINGNKEIVKVEIRNYKNELVKALVVNEDYKLYQQVLTDVYKTIVTKEFVNADEYLYVEGKKGYGLTSQIPAIFYSIVFEASLMYNTEFLSLKSGNKKITSMKIDTESFTYANSENSFIDLNIKLQEAINKYL
jgi:hypothetical protein